MLAGIAFLAFGFLAALAYLAYHQERDLVSYGLAGLALAAAFNGIELLIEPDGVTSRAFFLMFQILRFIASGAGLAFLTYTAAVEGKHFHARWKAQRDAELEALRAGLRLDARKDAETSRAQASR